MKFIENNPPRVYEVGASIKVEISDCGKLHLEPDEQVTFTTPEGGEYDVTRKDWGFYATPSLNSRLISYSLRGVLVKNRINHYFVMLVEKGKEDLFEKYISEEILTIVTWLDNEQDLNQI